ncbi:uncharacterized protein Z519_01565 [Cladophialophora bantiana CBS 173.52]|uniref:Clr5 domain-containing protein n=1 Tax=Cladophialophora bantiana (strain ATCC 10958 / CBS 173.52 / CDC B-1940 / NIH 8579) TaxID=1442370 RepID=A0A0D2F7C8_CLAB1|nr:uncharacterized protein Z519_01565 [Cladophialophora bantiana CBS 173.52]KIW97981.1 hypothetical protein Z519_01565 [Cladophialophora bantiana CBS 173.52]
MPGLNADVNATDPKWDPLWDPFRDTICTLYLIEDQSLEKVMEEMKTKYQFTATYAYQLSLRSKAQYERPSEDGTSEKT